MFPRHLPGPPPRPAPAEPEPPPGPSTVTDVLDWRGRRYTVGPSARLLTGAPRSVLLARALLAVAAVGVLQFGYGAAVPLLTAAHGWSPAQALTPFLVWALVQGCFAPVPRLLRTRGLLHPGTAICAGAALCAVAVYTVGHTTDPLTAVAGYGLLGGVGAGLVYHSCVDLVGGWFPDRHTVRLGAVGGAFALGSVPLLPALALGPPSGDPGTAATVLAVAVLVLGVAGGAGQRGAPACWWPPGSDPRAAALRRGADPPAARDFTAGQAWASGRSLHALHAIVALSGTVGLFTLVVLPPVLSGLGRDPTQVAVAVTAFAVGSGVGRLAASGAAERAGRRRTLTVLLAATTLGQAALAASAPDGPLPLLVTAVLVVGAGTGACYPLTRAITEGHFGTGQRGGTGQHRNAGRRRGQRGGMGEHGGTDAHRGAPRIGGTTRFRVPGEDDPARSADLAGLVHGSKAVGGLLGVGGATVLLSLVPDTAHTPVLAASGLLTAVAALLAARLRRPLPIRTLPPGAGTSPSPGVWTARRRSVPM
ncbi:MFS transporter [Nocardiopsis sp. NPDC058789]|uniref:MFS transporter n=1 Tax=Nocardiopsis sp. NPDC058789 TaxID=3346634 RepID=UPI0036710F07